MYGMRNTHMWNTEDLKLKHKYESNNECMALYICPNSENTHTKCTLM